VLPSSPPGYSRGQTRLDQDQATRWIFSKGESRDGPTEAHPQWLTFEFPDAFAAAALLYCALPRLRAASLPCRSRTTARIIGYSPRFELAAEPPGPSVRSHGARASFACYDFPYPFQGRQAGTFQIAEVQLLQQGEPLAPKGTVGTAARPWTSTPKRQLIPVAYPGKCRRARGPCRSSTTVPPEIFSSPTRSSPESSMRVPPAVACAVK